jgi:uncharacterized NAD(P)/FAD-binding protein YdhS
MPSGGEDNSRRMLANFASIETPPIGETYIAWVRRQPPDKLRRYRVDVDPADERTLFPRLLLGEYFRDQFIYLVDRARGFTVGVHELCEVADVDPRADGVWLSAPCLAAPVRFDDAVIVTGHVWPDETESTRSYFPSPWSGLVDAVIPAARIGIFGTSLSAIDAAMAVAVQHGDFWKGTDGNLLFEPDPGSQTLKITSMSRSGVLPEADF